MKIVKLSLLLAIAAFALTRPDRVLAEPPTYEIGKTSFVKEVWIKKGGFFEKVRLIEIEMSNAGSFELQVVDTAGKVISTGKRDNAHGGWHTFDFSSGMVPPVRNGTYKLKLVNTSAGTRQIKQGRISFW